MGRLADNDNVFHVRAINEDSKNKLTTYKIVEPFGKGTMKSYQPFKGIEVIYNDVYIKKLIKDTCKFSQDTIEINYCYSGNMEARFINKKMTFMNEGDLSIYGYKCNVLYCSFMDKPYKGITIMISAKEALEDIHSFTGLDREEINAFMAKITEIDKCVVTNAGKGLNHIFKEFFVLPEKHLLSHMRLKVMEALLYLIGETNYNLDFSNYFMESFVEKMDRARELLLQDLKKHITIDELSKEVGVNTTDLKKSFKAIYGDTIYSHLRKHRMEKARELLLESDLKIIDIACAVGYSNASKFSSTFKKIYGVKPNQYRLKK